MAHAEPVAVVGAACRLPGADTPEAFWALMQRGEPAVVPVPPSRWRWDTQAGFPPQVQAACLQQGGFLSGLDQFDAAFFNLAEPEAARLDPQQKLALEVAWQALESACILPADLAGSDTAVIMGVGHSDHAHKLRNDHGSYDGRLGPSGYEGFAAHRVSHGLGLKGPSFSVNAACASSLHAIHLACQALQCGETSLALAGGVNVHLAVDESVSCALAGWLAEDGRCKSFRAGADGYVRSEGCGMVVLKRLDDALHNGDPVWGVIRASALGHNGMTPGITWPSGNGQRDLLRRLLVRGGLAAQDVGVLEAHGIGSALADRIEASAFTDVLASGREPGNPLRVGCCKPQLGHLEAASGVAGLIKLLLCLRHGALPALAGSGPLNPEIRPHPAVRWLTVPEVWPSTDKGRRRALLTNFSFGGAHAGLIVEEAPPVETKAIPALAGPRLLALRARSAIGLQALRRRLCRHLDLTGQPLNDDQLHTLNLHRSEFKSHRLAFVAADLTGLEAALRQGEPVEAAPPAAAPPSLGPAAAGCPALGHDWPDPAAELRRWYVTSRLLDHWLAQGHALPAPAARPGPADQQTDTLQEFWRHARDQLGPAFPAAPGPQDDWPLALARQMMAGYCAGAPLHWAWLASGRKTAVESHPFDRRPSWFHAEARSEPAPLAC